MSEKITFIKNKLDAISPSFCAAKWQQVTMHLQTGHTHSCHHPPTHKIPLNELASNPSALHNTKFKKEERRMMLAGERPKGCDYCWRIEDSGSISDRVYKSAEPWSEYHIDAIKDRSWDDNVIPSYVEVSFSNVCNFKCSYCSPQVSSKWMEEIERFGPYPTSGRFGNLEWLKSQDALPIPHKDENPYVDAFWKWWPTASQKLDHFRITGGEPLMTKDTIKILDYVIETPHPNLHLSINSNMCVPDVLLDKFIEKIKIVCTENKVKQFKIFTSCDTYGKQAEYIRHGLDYDVWLKNIERVLSEVPNCTFTIMSTINALSIFQYDRFLEDVLRIKKQYYKPGMPHSALILDTPYLRWPAHQALFILPIDMIHRMKSQIDFMFSNQQGPSNPHQGFFEWEADKFKRIYQMLMEREDSIEVTIDQKDFVRFVDEHDHRRGTNFLGTFPEMAEFYNQIKAQL